MLLKDALWALSDAEILAVAETVRSTRDELPDSGGYQEYLEILHAEMVKRNGKTQLNPDGTFTFLSRLT